MEKKDPWKFTLEELEKNPELNIGILTGKLSEIIALDVDQSKILGYNPGPMIEKDLWSIQRQMELD